MEEIREIKGRIKQIEKETSAILWALGAATGILIVLIIYF